MSDKTKVLVSAINATATVAIAYILFGQKRK